MARVNKSYPSLLQGVSQQSESVRAPGTHWEQINMIPDPVLGLTRRPGSLFQDSLQAAVIDLSENPDGRLDWYPDAQNYKALDFRVGGSEFTLYARHRTEPSTETLPAFACFNRTTGRYIELTRPVTDAALDLLEAGGVSASVAVGRYLFLAGNTMTPEYALSYDWAPESNQKRHVIWIRGGAYSRTYRMALIRGNQKLWVEYTTLSASYPATLDTSDLNPLDPEYSKKVADRTNAYNSAAVQWAGDALADAVPENIAAKLAEELTKCGFLESGATVVVDGSTITITASSIEDVECDDGGDQGLMRAVGNRVGAAELLSTVHFAGKIVQVRPTGDTDGRVYYMQAVSKDRSMGRFTSVTWEECAGVAITPTQALAFLTVDDSGEAFITSDPALMQTHDVGTSDFPAYSASVCGDVTSNPIPPFFDKTITAMALFQDRLILMGGNAVYASRPGDYLNLWRASVLTVLPNDPVSFTAIGGEDDIVRSTVVYDRNLILWGEKQQYILNGRAPLTPSTAASPLFSVIPDATFTPPLLSGNFLYYTQYKNGIASVHQFQPGPVVETPETYELTEGLANYIPGRPLELVASATPSALFLRTDAAPSSVFVYHYRDAPNGQRQQGAWHRWDFDRDYVDLGAIAGISVHKGQLQLQFVRASSFGYEEPYNVEESLDLVVDRISLNAADNPNPFLDSMARRDGEDYVFSFRLGTDYTYEACGPAGYYVGTPSGGLPGFWEAYSTAWPFEELAEPLPAPMFGVQMTGLVALESPLLRDRSGVVIEEGRLTVSGLRVTLANTGGVAYRISGLQLLPEGDYAAGEGRPTTQFWVNYRGAEYPPQAPIDMDEIHVGLDCGDDPDLLPIYLPWLPNAGLVQQESIQGPLVVDNNTPLPSTPDALFNPEYAGYPDLAWSRPYLIDGDDEFQWGGTTVFNQFDARVRSSLRIPVGRESREYRAALRTVLWAPLTITTVEWDGQYFNNTRRI